MASWHTILLTVLWMVIWTAAGGPQPPAHAVVSLDSTQLLRLIVGGVTSNIRPLVDKIDTRIEGLESRLGSMEVRLNAIDYKLDSIDARLDDLASTNSELSSRQSELASKLDSVENRLSSRMDTLASRVGFDNVEQLSARLEDLVSRLDGLPDMTEEQGQPRQANPRPQLLPRDCSELPDGSESGVHVIYPGLDRSGPPVATFCDQDTDGGGWTVIQRRADIQPRQDFNRTWTAYREGFGELGKEFWWGLKHVQRLTAPRDRRYQLRVELTDFDGGHRYATYDQFRVGSEADGFRLSLCSYGGDAGDSMASINGWKFSTWDRDNDAFPWNCAQVRGGGWWFDACSSSHLNGLYLPGGQIRMEGIVWHSWKRSFYSLKETNMMLRPFGTD